MRLKVASVSANTNDFGLRGVLLVADTGEVYQAAGSGLNLPKKGQVIDTGDRDPIAHLTAISLELPKYLRTAEPHVITDVWADPEPGAT